MGRIKTGLMKRTTLKIYHKYKEKFTNNFEQNKKTVESLVQFPNKKFRNIIAGYLTRLVRRGVD